VNYHSPEPVPCLESGSPLYLLRPTQGYALSLAKGYRCYPSRDALLFIVKFVQYYPFSKDTIDSLFGKIAKELVSRRELS